MSEQATATPVSAITPEHAETIAALLPLANPSPATIEQKVENATVQAAALASIFNPLVGAMIAAGAQVEPLIFSFTQLIAALFRHHTKS